MKLDDIVIWILTYVMACITAPSRVEEIGQKTPTKENFIGAAEFADNSYMEQICGILSVNDPFDKGTISRIRGIVLLAIDETSE